MYSFMRVTSMTRFWETDNNNCAGRPDPAESPISYTRTSRLLRSQQTSTARSDPISAIFFPLQLLIFCDDIEEGMPRSCVVGFVRETRPKTPLDVRYSVPGSGTASTHRQCRERCASFVVVGLRVRETRAIQGK